MKLPKPLWLSLHEAIERVMTYVGCDPCLEEDSPQRKSIESRLSIAFADEEIRTRGRLHAPYKYVGGQGLMAISDEYWEGGEIEWSANRITLSSLAGYISDVLGDEAFGILADELSGGYEKFIHTHVEVHREDLIKWLNSSQSDDASRSNTDATSAPVGSPRRNPKYDWDAFYVEIAVLGDLDNLPEFQAELERKMAAWCRENWGEEPSQSTLRKKISPIYNHPRRRQSQ